MNITLNENVIKKLHKAIFMNKTYGLDLLLNEIGFRKEKTNIFKKVKVGEYFVFPNTTKIKIHRLYKKLSDTKVLEIISNKKIDVEELDPLEVVVVITKI